MARHSRKANSQSSNDSNFSEEESSEGIRSDTDLTEPEDNEAQPYDAGNMALLFADNQYPPEYYI